MKRFKTFILWLFWALVGLFLTIVVLSYLPPTQRFIGEKVSQIIAKKLGTKVEIGSVHIGLLNYFVIDNVVILDQKNKNMLDAARIAAKVDLMQLIKEQKIRISSAQIFGLQAQLYKAQQEGNTNFQFVLDSLASHDNTKQTPLDLNIQSLIIRNSSVKYDEWYKPVTRGKLNTHHLDVRNISGHINLDSLTDNGIETEIRNLSFIETSGLDVKKLVLKLVANKAQATVRDLKLTLPQSQINIPLYTASFGSKQQKPNIATAQSEIKVERSVVTLSDLAFLAPALRRFHDKVYLQTHAKGNAQRIAIPQLKVFTEKGDLNINLQGNILSTQKPIAWNAKAKAIHINGNTLEKLAKALKINIPTQVLGLGNIHYTGTAKGHGNNIAAQGKLLSSIGNANVAIDIKGKHIKGEIHTKGFRIGNVLTASKLGMIVADLKVEGETDLSTISAHGTIPQFDYNGYSYRNIKVDGSFAHDTFNGLLALNDPNGSLYINGRVENIRSFIAHQKPIAVDAKINAKGVNLNKLNLTKALGNRQFSFASTLKGSGTSIDNLIATLNLRNFALLGQGNPININNLQLRVNNGLMGKSIDLASDFGTLKIDGKFDYPSLPQSILNILSHYLPTLLPSHSSLSKQKSRNAFALTANISNANLLKTLLGLKVDIGRYIDLTAYVDEPQHRLEVYLDAPQVMYANQHIQNLQATVATVNDELAVNLSGARVDDAGRHITLNLNGETQNGVFTAKSHFNAEGRNQLFGDINCQATFARQQGKLATLIHFHPSIIEIDTISLQVQPSDMVYARNTLDIKHFEISNKDQHIIVNGQTTGSANDSLTVQLKDLDVPYILDIVNFHSVEFGGYASGNIVLKQAFTNPQATASLNVTDFTFEEGHLGTLFVDANYKHSEGRINIEAHADEGENRTNVGGYVDLKRSYISLPIDAYNTNLDFLHSFCGSFMDNICLRGTGWCKVVGPLNKINLEGDVYATGSARVKTLGTTYNMNDCRVRLIPNEIIFDRDTISDDDQHIGILTGALHHQALKHLTFDINIEAQNLLAYNFPKPNGKDVFWGKVYGTGNCMIIGRDNEITMNVDMKPNKNSFITYNAAKNSIDENSFIRWRNVTPDSLLYRFNERLCIKPQEPEETHNDDAFSSDLHLNMLINANPDFTLRVLMDEATGDNISLNGNGVIRSTYYNKGAFQLFGNYNITRGMYDFTIQNVIKKQFAFQNGSSITFGGDPFTAALNLKGIYSIASVPMSDLQMGRSFRANNTRVDCLLNIEGTPGAPSVTFGLDLPMLSSDAKQMVHSVLNSEQDLNQQVLYLLAVGRFYPQASNNAIPNSPNQQGQASLAMQSILSGTLSQQINTVLSNVIKDNHWNFGANIATGNEGFSNAEYEGILSGSLLNNRLLINGQFGYRDNVATNTSSFIGDFDIKYLLLPSGNIALNFYNRANDRYFTRNSLNTQGIGVIMKKDFTTIRELFRLKPRKKKKK